MHSHEEEGKGKKQRKRPWKADHKVGDREPQESQKGGRKDER